MKFKLNIPCLIEKNSTVEFREAFKVTLNVFGFVMKIKKGQVITKIFAAPETFVSEICLAITKCLPTPVINE